MAVRSLRPNHERTGVPGGDLRASVRDRGGLALLALSPPLPFSECVPIVEVDQPAGGPALYGLDGTDLRYTPDGHLTCSTHVVVPGLPLSLLTLGGVLIAVSLAGRN